MIVRLSVALFGLIILWAVCSVVILDIYDLTTEILFGGMDWGAYKENMWNDFYYYYQVQSAILFSLVLTLVLWLPVRYAIRALRFKRKFCLWPWQVDPKDSTSYHGDVEILLEKAALHFEWAIDEREKLRIAVESFTLMKYQTLKKGNKIVYHWKEKFWKLHRLVAYFKLPVKESFKDYLPEQKAL